MRSMSERPIRKQLYTSIVTALALGASVVMSSHAQEGDTDPVPSLDIVLVEAPEGGELPEVTEPLPTLPEGIALDNDGNAYPEGGPTGLYNAIVDKQQKLGMIGVYDPDGNLVDVIYEGGNYGQQNALSRLRANLERKLEKDGLLDGGTDVPEVEPLPEEVVELAELLDTLEEGPTDEPVPALPEGVALDNNGDPYPEGGPGGLYTAISDKQNKLEMKGVYDADGNLENVTYEGGNSGLKTALSRLRGNLERKLKKLGLYDDTPTVDALATSTELGIASNSARTGKTGIDRSKKLEKSVTRERSTRERIAKPVVRSERVARERFQKPVKVTSFRPQRPEKSVRFEKPQRPQAKPQRPQKPEKPAKPERPGRS